MDRVGREDAARRSEALDAFRDDDGLAVEVAVLVDHLARVEPDPHLDGCVESVAMEVTHLHLHVAGSRDRSASGGECGHQSVAHLLDEGATVRRDSRACHLLDLAADLTGSVVAECLVEAGRFDQVGEQNGDGALGDLLLCHLPGTHSLAIAAV